jgi:nitrous oxide reductase accessory protein NosL
MVKKLAAILVAGAFAAPLSTASAAPDKKKEAATCPVCKMTLASKKDDKNPVAVKVGKKVMYCCSGCDMSAWKKDKKGVPIAPAPEKTKK